MTTTSGRTDIISATNHCQQATTSVQGELEMFHRVGDVQPIPVDPGRRQRLVQQLARRVHQRRAGAASLVDRVQVTLFPVITGQTGLNAIFQGAPDFGLELVEHRTLDGHIQELIYRPTLH
jgi:hypothetical protein